MHDAASPAPHALAIDPQAMATFQKRLDDGPVTMLNLLKFKPGGAAMYRQYMDEVAPLLAGVGGRLVFSGKAAEKLTGNEDWDLMLLVEYPKRASLAAMFTSDAYKAIAHLRQDALERAVLYAMDPMEA